MALYLLEPEELEKPLLHESLLNQSTVKKALVQNPVASVRLALKLIKGNLST